MVEQKNLALLLKFHLRNQAEPSCPLPIDNVFNFRCLCGQSASFTGEEVRGAMARNRRSKLLWGNTEEDQEKDAA